MDTMTTASFLVMWILLLVSMFILAMQSVKRYAKRVRSLNKAHFVWVLEIVGSNECRQQLEKQQTDFLESFEKYTNREVKMLHASARDTSFIMAIGLMAGASLGYFFNRSVWPYPNVVVALLAGVLMLVWGAYNHLKYRQLKKFTE